MPRCAATSWAFEACAPACATIARMSLPAAPNPVAPPSWLKADDAFFRPFLARPELALVPESCPAERALHAALHAAPLHRPVPNALSSIADADARDSYRLFLHFRDAVLAAGAPEAYYLQLFPRAGSGRPARPIDIPPLFIDLLVGAVLQQALQGVDDAYVLRAADLLHRSQRITVQKSQVLAADQASVDLLADTGGVGDIGRFLKEAGAPTQAIDMQVLTDANAGDFFRSIRSGEGEGKGDGESQAALARQAAQRHRFVLDLTHEVSNELAHGLVFRMTRARSGLGALATVLELWMRHFLGIAVRVQPLQKIDDAAWRWHVGLDADASALLNDLYESREVDADRLARLVSLFRLDFTDPADMRADVAGKPVYLALMASSRGTLKLKPQNLILNLPLRTLA
jgi:Family of unknown function (DUF6352)